MILPNEEIQYITWTKKHGLTIKYADGLTQTMADAELKFNPMTDAGILTEVYTTGFGTRCRREAGRYATLRFEERKR